MKKYNSLAYLVFIALAVSACGGRYTATLNSTKEGIIEYQGDGMGLLPPPGPREMAKAYKTQKEADRLVNLRNGVKESVYVGAVVNVDLVRTIIVFPPESSDTVTLKPGEYYFFETKDIPEYIYVSYRGLDRTEKAKVFATKSLYNGVACDYGARINF